MIIEPTIKPEKIRENESDFGSSVSLSIWKKIINNQVWIEKNIPIGFILFFYASMQDANGNQIAPPNPSIWAQCDGQVVNDADSPLNGVTLPDLRNLFLKGSEEEGLTGGQSTINIQHNHSGATGDTNDKGDNVADVGSDRRTGSIHHHSIDNRWSTVESIIPKFFGLQAFIRYK